MPDQSVPTPKSATTYQSLAAKFEKDQKDPRGFTYITGEQCVSRLNEVLGYDGWSFRIKEHGFDTESDTVWVLGELIIYSENGIQFRTHAGEGTMVGVLTREQFGSQAHNRRRDNGAILDYGFDLKGAATDALKKCATLVGVGLYLSAKEEKAGSVPNQGGTKDRSPGRPPAQTQAPSSPSPARPAPSEPNLGMSTNLDEDDGSLAVQDDICSQCGKIITAVRRQDGSTMTGHELAERARSDFGLPMCATHYKAALAAKSSEAGTKAPQEPKAPQNGAQGQQRASLRDPGTGMLDPNLIQIGYGQFVAGQLCKGYRAPAAKGKQNFYATLGTATGYNRDTVHALLGLSVDKDTHIESWLEAAETQLGSLMNLMIRHHQNPEDTRIPTLADLA